MERNFFSTGGRNSDAGISWGTARLAVLIRDGQAVPSIQFGEEFPDCESWPPATTSEDAERQARDLEYRRAGRGCVGKVREVWAPKGALLLVGSSVSGQNWPGGGALEWRTLCAYEPGDETQAKAMAILQEVRPLLNAWADGVVASAYSHIQWLLTGERLRRPFEKVGGRKTAGAGVRAAVARRLGVPGAHCAGRNVAWDLIRIAQATGWRPAVPYPSGRVVTWAGVEFHLAPGWRLVEVNPPALAPRVY